MRISDWSSDVCSSDLTCLTRAAATVFAPRRHPAGMLLRGELWPAKAEISTVPPDGRMPNMTGAVIYSYRSEALTSELQSLKRITYAVLCLTKKKRSVVE